MNKKTILHVMNGATFIPPYIDFLEKNFADFDRHCFIIGAVVDGFSVKSKNNIILSTGCTKYGYYSQLVRLMYQAEKIILHGLFDKRIIQILALQPWLLFKCYWVIWGGDLYHYQLRSRTFKENIFERTRAFVIRRIGHFVTYVKGDYELARKWYGCEGKYHDCLIYVSNLYKSYKTGSKSDKKINILVGNSADPSNNHLEVFEKLLQFQNENICIYAPLSYGDGEYARHIAKLGSDIFGDKFVPLLDFMPFDKYLALLAEIDVVIFAHRRQQAMGNTITLLGLGKKVYMRSDVTSWGVFGEIGVKIFDFLNVDLVPMSNEDSKNNQLLVKSFFSEAVLVKQWHAVFEE